MIDSFEELAEAYRVFGDKTRLHILALLTQGELCVCDLVSVLNMSQPGISQHLRKLKQVGFVKERKTAQWVYYSLDGAKFPLFMDIVDSLPNVAKEWEVLQSQGLGTRCNFSS